jgi:hypothetical protein
MANMLQRMLGAARLDASTFEEVEADHKATGQAMLVVVLAALAAGLGTAGRGEHGFGGGLGLALVALGAWFLWAATTWFVGTKILPGPQTSSNLGELLRTIGFAAAPGILRILAAIPALGGPIVHIANLWMLAAMVVGVRQALDYTSTGRALAVCLVGFVIYVGVFLAATVFLGIGAVFLGRALGG